jgi:hypothetical protein
VRRPLVLGSVLVGLVVVLLVVAEVAVRLVAAHEVSSVARRELRATSASIRLGDTPRLLDLARNRAARVSVSATGAQVCALPGVDLEATFHDLSLHGGHRVSSTDAHITLTASGLTRFVDGLLPAALAVKVAADPSAGTLRLTLGPAGALGVAVRPTLHGSRLVLRPVSVTLLGQHVTEAALDRVTGGAALSRDLAGLPLDMSPTAARVVPAGLVLDLHGGPARLDAAGATC